MSRKKKKDFCSRLTLWKYIYLHELKYKEQFQPKGIFFPFLSFLFFFNSQLSLQQVFGLLLPHRPTWMTPQLFCFRSEQRYYILINSYIYTQYPMNSGNKWLSNKKVISDIISVTFYESEWKKNRQWTISHLYIKHKTEYFKILSQVFLLLNL